LSFSPLWGAFGLLHANYGRVVDGGNKEYQIMFATSGYEDDFSEAQEDGEYIDGYLYGVKGACLWKQETADKIEVSFKNGRKQFFNNPLDLPIYIGDNVAIDCKPGYDIGVVTLKGELVKHQIQRKNQNKFNQRFNNTHWFLITCSFDCR